MLITGENPLFVAKPYLRKDYSALRIYTLFLIGIKFFIEGSYILHLISITLRNIVKLFWEKCQKRFGCNEICFTFAPAFRNEGCSLRQRCDNKCDSGFLTKNTNNFSKKVCRNKKSSIFAPPKSDSGRVAGIETEKEFWLVFKNHQSKIKNIKTFFET